MAREWSKLLMLILSSLKISKQPLFVCVCVCKDPWALIGFLLLPPASINRWRCSHTLRCCAPQDKEPPTSLRYQTHSSSSARYQRIFWQIHVWVFMWGAAATDDVTFNDPHACRVISAECHLWRAAAALWRSCACVNFIFCYLFGLQFLSVALGLNKRRQVSVIFFIWGYCSHRVLILIRVHWFNPPSLQIHPPNYIHCLLNPCQCRCFSLLFLFG